MTGATSSRYPGRYPGRSFFGRCGQPPCHPARRATREEGVRHVLHVGSGAALGRGGPAGRRGVPAGAGLARRRGGRLPGARDLASALLVKGRVAGLVPGNASGSTARLAPGIAPRLAPGIAPRLAPGIARRLVTRPGSPFHARRHGGSYEYDDFTHPGVRGRRRAAAPPGPPGSSTTRRPPRSPSICSSVTTPSRCPAPLSPAVVGRRRGTVNSPGSRRPGLGRAPRPVPEIDPELVERPARVLPGVAGCCGRLRVARTRN